MKEPVCLELKLKLALEAVTERDLISNESRNFYGEGFLAGFDKAMELACAGWEAILKIKEIKDETTKYQSPKIIIRRRTE